MKGNKGFTEVAVLVTIIAGMFLLFVPNPVSKVVGVGVKPNTVVQKESLVEKVDLLKDKDGNIIGTKTVTETGESTADKQPKSWLDSLLALPRLWLLLMILGCFVPGVAGFMHMINRKLASAYKATVKEWQGNTRQIVASVEKGLDTLEDVAAKKKFMDAMSMVQDTKVKDLVKELKKKNVE